MDIVRESFKRRDVVLCHLGWGEGRLGSCSVSQIQIEGLGFSFGS
ncbi:unnamed protein product [Fusarium venenatum]|uniref:Uncharacterized protein n=1 Tax=Fusarium venenatum TaxID=56646 RepID=A0A2L2SVT2_9HYPO|nr:uncharacterized protein FVRRES_04965 [Fusarium venenatum]CEI60529.1 unnamed protein product [Fusarium venenatum]